MRSHYKWMLGVVGCLVLTVCFLLLMQPPSDPIRKAVDAEIRFSSLSYSNSVLAEKNILALGPVAIPYLAEASQRTNSDFQEWWALKHGQSKLLSRISAKPLSSQEIRAGASYLLHKTLRDKSMAPAIPAMLVHSNETIRGRGCSALVSGMDILGQNKHILVMDLLPALDSPDPLVRAVTLYVIGEMGGRMQIPTTTVVKFCGDPDESVRFEAARALRETGVSIDEGLTNLKNLTLSKSVDIKIQAACELFKLRRRDDLSLMPVFLEGALNPNSEWQSIALSRLTEYGTNAAFALPQITPLLNSPDEWTRKIATNAVKVLSGQGYLDGGVERIFRFHSKDPRFSNW